MLEDIQKKIEKVANDLVAQALGQVVGFAVVLEANDDLTSEKLLDYGRAMTKLIGAEPAFIAAYASALRVARDAAKSLERKP